MKKIFLGIIIATMAIVGTLLFYKESKAPIDTDTNLETISSEVPYTENTAVSIKETSPETTTTPVTVTNTVIPEPKPTPKLPITPPTTPPGPKTYTMTEVATHNTEASCYSAINGKVYNLSAWIEKHPGGDRAILSICGKDGTSAFSNQHGGQNKPENILAGFQIGILAS